MPYKVIVAHPGRQHSYRLATALYKADMLSSYVTTIYDKPTSRSMQLVKCALNEDGRKRASGRRMKEVPDEKVVQYGVFRGYTEALLNRIDKGRNFCRALHRQNADYFGERVARLAIETNADAVVLYDTNARRCFEILAEKAPQIKRIMDVSIAERHYMKKIYEREIAASGHDDLRRENEYMWDERIMDKHLREFQVTQYFLAGSEFVKQSLIDSGAAEESIYILPYGANVSSAIERRPKTDGDRLHVLFVGQVTYRKGITTLIDAISHLPADKVDLTVVGAFNKNAWFVEEGRKHSNITFTGHVTIDQMQAIYEKAGVFVIDSFAEGMAQVGIEAMACGLPIICSFNSGLSEAVRDGESGYVIPCGDVPALRDKLQWFIDHPERIRAMGNAARETAQDYTWERYEENAAKIISSIIADK